MDMNGDGVSILMGGGAFGALCGVLGAWIKARWNRTKVEPTPLPVRTHRAEEWAKKDDVEKLRDEFEHHVSENTREHENLYSRINRNDRETSEIKGILSAIREDIGLIKHKLFKTGAK